jgi:hypothetical protein
VTTILEHLCAQPMECVEALHDGRSADNRQQRERKDASPPGDRA